MEQQFTKKRKLAFDWYQQLPGRSTSFDEFYSAVWQNIRDNGGMRLTPYGILILQAINYEKWGIKVKNTPKNGLILVQMDKYLDSPYYTDGRKNLLVVYDESIATQLILYDGDLAAYLNAFSQFNN